ncbi:MAG: DUF3488 and transglutaminase-like domain-containing protein, partial [Actinobacteria bacterium]|nr:DUF3488 and transglutaminase-like domain-containing protein [Actinomycetota bacterium]
MASTVAANPRPPAAPVQSGPDGSGRPADPTGPQGRGPSGASERGEQPGRGHSGGWRSDRSLAGTLALTGLTLAVALGFGRLFTGAGFLAPVVLTTLASHAIAWWCRRRNIATAAAGAATTAVAALVGVWTVLGHTTAYGLPTPHTLGSALEALASARGAFSVVKAPAAVLPGFVLATVLALGISAFMADWAAFRLRATFEAIIPAFTLFIFTSALGTAHHRSLAVMLFVAGVLGFVLVHGLARSNGAGAWFGGRPANGPRTLLRTAAALGAGCLLFGLVVGPKLPGADDPPVVRYKNRAQAGASNRTTVSPLVDIRGRLVERAGVEVFTVRASVRSYWRLTSLDTFDGTIWSSNDTYRTTRGGIATDEPLRPDLPVTQSDQEFTVRRLASTWAPAAFRPERVIGLREVSYNRGSASIITPSETTDGLTYSVRSKVAELTPELLAGAPAQAPPAVAERYLALPDISGTIRQEARRIVSAARARTPYEQARALQDHFHRNFRYDLNARQGHDEEALENFLLRNRRGYCEQFAGSYAVLARTLGLPSRVAVGFTPGELQSDGLYHVRDEHAHAWPEVYLHGYGWVAFEPTPGRGAPGAEPYTGLPEAQDASGAPTTATTAAPTQTTVASEESPATSAPAPEDTTPTPLGDAGDEGGLPALVRLGLAGLGLVALWALVVPALHVRRRRRRHRGRSLGQPRRQRHDRRRARPRARLLPPERTPLCDRGLLARVRAASLARRSRDGRRAHPDVRAHALRRARRRRRRYMELPIRTSTGARLPKRPQAARQLDPRWRDVLRQARVLLPPEIRSRL